MRFKNRGKFTLPDSAGNVQVEDRVAYARCDAEFFVHVRNSATNLGLAEQTKKSAKIERDFSQKLPGFFPE